MKLIRIPEYNAMHPAIGISEIWGYSYHARSRTLYAILDNKTGGRIVCHHVSLVDAGRMLELCAGSREIHSHDGNVISHVMENSRAAEGYFRSGIKCGKMNK